jgi:glutamate-1-semialdehyde 2,1-aminomutase
MAAGKVMLKTLKDSPGVYAELEYLSAKLHDGLLKNIAATGVAATVNRVGSMLTLFFGADKVTDFDTAMKSNTAQYASYFKASLDAGIYLAPSQFEAAFVSNAHTDEDIEQTLEASLAAMQAIAAQQ